MILVISFFSVVAVKSSTIAKYGLRAFTFEFICVFSFALDILRSFITGIYREEFNDTVLNPKKVALYVGTKTKIKSCYL